MVVGQDISRSASIPGDSSDDLILVPIIKEQDSTKAGLTNQREDMHVGIFARLVGLEYLGMWEDKFARLYSPYFEEQTNRFRDEGLQELIETFACDDDTIQILSGLLISVFNYQLMDKGPAIFEADSPKLLAIQERFFIRIFGTSIGQKAYLTHLLLMVEKGRVTTQQYEWLAIGTDLALMYYKSEYPKGLELRQRLNDIAKRIIQSYRTYGYVKTNAQPARVIEHISLKVLFVKILSQLPQKVVADIDDALSPSYQKDTLRTLRQNRGDIIIEVFYFVYHLLERQLLHLAGAEQKDAILNYAASEAILELESKCGNKTQVGIQIIDNLGRKLNEYASYSDVLCVSNTLVGPSVIKHAVGLVCDKLKPVDSLFPRQCTRWFWQVHQILSKSVLNIHWNEKHKNNAWDISSNLEDVDKTWLDAVLNETYTTMIPF